LTQSQLHELIESDQGRVLLEAAEERATPKSELEAFALENDLTKGH
jgi:hypothetical protein